MLHNDYMQVGGEYFSVRAEAEALRSIGVDVHLFTVTNDQLGAGSSSKIDVIRTVSRGGRREVEHAIERFRPDIVHAQNLFPRLGGGAINAVGRARVPWVRTLRNYRLTCLSANHRRDGQACFDCNDSATAYPGVRHACYRNSTAASAGALVYSAIEKKSAEKFQPSAYIVLSAAMQQRLSARISDVPLHIRPNIVSRPAITPGERKRAGCAFVGRLTEEKGIDVFLRVAEENPEVDFFIVGSGPLEGKVRVVADRCRNVIYKGELTHEGCAGIMASVRAVVVPSQWEEPFGRVAAEAISVGALPIVPPYGGLPEIVQGLGLSLVAQENTVASYSSIVRAIVDLTEVQFRHESSTAESIWAERYSPKGGGQALLKIYESVLNVA